MPRHSCIYAKEHPSGCSFCSVDLESRLAQRVNDAQRMRAVLRFHRDLQNGVADIEIHVRSVVMDGHDVCAILADDAGHQFKLARTVLHQDAELADAARAQQTLFND